MDILIGITYPKEILRIRVLIKDKGEEKEEGDTIKESVKMEQLIDNIFKLKVY